MVHSLNFGACGLRATARRVLPDSAAEARTARMRCASIPQSARRALGCTVAREFASLPPFIQIDGNAREAGGRRSGKIQISSAKRIGQDAFAQKPFLWNFRKSQLPSAEKIRAFAAF